MPDAFLAGKPAAAINEADRVEFAHAVMQGKLSDARAEEFHNRPDDSPRGLVLLALKRVAADYPA